MNGLNQQLHDFGYSVIEAAWWKEFAEKFLTQKRRELPENTCCKCAYEELDEIIAEIKAAQRRVSPRTERLTVVLRVPSDTRRRLTQ